MAGACAWMILISVIVESGVFEESSRLGILLFFSLMMICAAGVAYSKPGKWLVTLPLWSLIGFQAFRLPLEFIIHQWANQGTVSTAMTWNGSNFDVVTGIAALVCAPLSKRSPRAARVFNAIGLLLLLNMMRVMLMSAPQLLMNLPYVWVGSICASGALIGHLILFRKLRA